MITLGYGRLGDGIFVPHTDVLKNLNRTFRRAGIDVAYSEGFNKHMRLKMTQPLPLGVADRDGYVTADVDWDVSDFLKKFNENCPPYLRGFSAYSTEKNPNLAGIIDGSIYYIDGISNTAQRNFISKIDGNYTVVLKKGEERKPIGGLIKWIRVVETGFIVFLAFGNVNLRVDALLSAINEDIGTNFNVTNVARTTQTIGTKPVREYLDEICREKSTSK